MVKSENSKNSARLFLSQIDEDFDPARDLVLGPWCFIGHERTSPKWESLPFFDAFDSGQDLQEAVANVEDLLAHRVTLLQTTLNRRHSVNYSFAFWWTLAQRWMGNLISSSWRRWVHLNKFIDLYGAHELNVIVSSDPETASWDFSDSVDFSKRGLQSERFDHWLWSQCVGRMVPKAWHLTTGSGSIAREESPIPDPPARSNVLRRMVRSRLGRLPFADVPGSSAVAIGFFSAYVSILPRRSAAKFQAAPCTTPGDKFPPEFLALLDVLIEKTMPLSLGLDFAKRDSVAKSMTYVTGRLCISGSATINDTANFQTAHAIEAGERIVHIQHGSDYGTMAHAIFEASGEYLNDAFLTWGWTEQNSHPGRFIPVPAPGLSRLRNRHRSKTNDVILVGTKMTLNSRRVDYAPQPTQIILYRREKLCFVAALNASTRRSLIYRPYKRAKSDLEDAAFMQSNVKDLRLCEGDLDQAILGCRLLVLDHPGTLLNIALAANVPTICYWNPDAWPLAPEAAPFFNALAKAGILFPNADLAAGHVNTVFENPDAWWSSTDVQIARTNWSYQFARTSKFWWWHWMWALARI
jgi:hypothetical protein